MKKIILLGYGGSILDLKFAYSKYAKHFENVDIYYYKYNATLFDEETGGTFNLFATYMSPNMLLQIGDKIDTIPYFKLFDKKGYIQKNVLKKLITYQAIKQNK